MNENTPVFAESDFRHKHACRFHTFFTLCPWIYEQGSEYRTYIPVKAFVGGGGGGGGGIVL